ncbi:hypothetical protein RRG08_018289 [Elysia crispata]|uniref:Uncharacterized protein n=1 Tax=Elysia crispata TaxID=231223 RepID=A0AAE1CRK6_9GAST|nr:hypothetical protein RRG08_018289 [Elysia crispata]
MYLACNTPIPSRLTKIQSPTAGEGETADYGSPAHVDPARRAATDSPARDGGRGASLRYLLCIRSLDFTDSIRLSQVPVLFDFQDIVPPKK